MSIRIDENEDIRTIQGGPVDLHKQSAAKAWANLNGTGTIALRDSLNISSVVDNGTGDYTFNYTDNFLNANYSFSPSGGIGATGSGSRSISIANDDPSISSIRVVSETSSGSDDDIEYVTLIVLGDLA